MQAGDTKAGPVWVAGADTLIGGAIVAALVRRGVAVADETAAGVDVDLADAKAVDDFVARVRPRQVYLAAGESGGIAYNQQHPATLMLHNLQVLTSIVPAAARHGVGKLLYLASSCSYPRACPQPMAVGSLHTGPLEPTNVAYAMAKLSGIELVRAFRREHRAPFVTVIPANSFGPGDDFSEENSHVVGALLRRFDAAKRDGADSVTIWGTGRPRREFVYAPDLAEACLFVMERYDSDDPINVGSGQDHSIAELAALCAQVVGFTGEIRYDTGRPDGMPEKRLDAGPLHKLGWRDTTPLALALKDTYAWYCQTRNRG